MKKIFRRIVRVLIILIVILTKLYFFAIYVKPIGQKALEAFLFGQPVIDVHLHISRGNPDSKLYDQYDGYAADPELLKPVLDKCPNLRIYLMHYGCLYSDEALAIMEEYENVYCDNYAISLKLPKILWEHNLRTLYKQDFGNRVMFGHDFAGTIRENIEVIYGIDWLTEDHKRDIFYNNAATFLKLSDEEISKHYETVKNQTTGYNI